MIEQLFEKLPYAEIDIKFEISSNGFNTEVGFVVEGYDGQGNKYNLVSGITNTVDNALEIIKQDLTNRLKQLEEDLNG